MHIFEDGLITEFLRQTLHMITELTGHGALLIQILLLNLFQGAICGAEPKSARMNLGLNHHDFKRRDSKKRLYVLSAFGWAV